MATKENKSMVELAYELQKGAKPTTFIALYDKVSKKLGFTEEEKRAHIAQFYTDITASGDFLYTGNDLWDVKSNQKLEALDSEFYKEHSYDFGDEEEQEEEKPKTRTRKSSKKEIVTVQTEEGDVINTIDESSDDEIDEDAYLNGDDSYDADYDPYEKDFDAQLDEDDSDEDEAGYSDEEYEEIMDDYEDMYEN